jgi:hypothetical protein
MGGAGGKSKQDGKYRVVLQIGRQMQGCSLVGPLGVGFGPDHVTLAKVVTGTAPAKGQRFKDGKLVDLDVIAVGRFSPVAGRDEIPEVFLRQEAEIGTVFLKRVRTLQENGWELWQEDGIG